MLSLQSVLTGAVFQYQSNYVQRLTLQLEDAKKKFLMLTRDKMLMEEYIWVAEFRISATIGSGKCVA